MAITKSIQYAIFKKIAIVEFYLFQKQGFLRIKTKCSNDFPKKLLFEVNIHQLRVWKKLKGFTEGNSKNLRLRSHGTGQIRDRTQIRPK